MATKENKRLTGTVFFESGRGNTLDIIFPEIKIGGIFIYGTNKTKIRYTPGIKLTNLDSFVEVVVKNLDLIYSTMEGKLLIDKLTASKKKYHINQVANLVSKYNVKKAQFGLGVNAEFDTLFANYIRKKEYANAKKLSLKIDDLFVGVFNGNYVTAWDNHNYDNVKMNLTLCLAHELFHAYQFEIGYDNGDFVAAYSERTGEVALLEAQACGFENYLRAILFKDTKYENIRGTYSFSLITEFREKPDWWDYLIGFDYFESKDFIEKEKGYIVWKKKFQDRIRKKSKELFN